MIIQGNLGFLQFPVCTKPRSNITGQDRLPPSTQKYWLHARWCPSFRWLVERTGLTTFCGDEITVVRWVHVNQQTTMGSYHTHSFLLIPILLVSPPHLTFHIQGVIPFVGLYFGLTLPYPLKTRSYPQKQDWTKKSMSTSWTLPGISSWDSTRQN